MFVPKEKAYEFVGNEMKFDEFFAPYLERGEEVDLKKNIELFFGSVQKY